MTIWGFRKEMEGKNTGFLSFDYLGLFMYLRLQLGKVLGICFITTWGFSGFALCPGGERKENGVCLGVLSSCAVFFSCRGIL